MAVLHEKRPAEDRPLLGIIRSTFGAHLRACTDYHKTVLGVTSLTVSMYCLCSVNGKKKAR